MRPLLLAVTALAIMTAGPAAADPAPPPAPPPQCMQMGTYPFPHPVLSPCGWHQLPNSTRWAAPDYNGPQ